MLNKSRRSASELVREFYSTILGAAKDLAKGMSKKADFIEYIVRILNDLAGIVYEEGAGVKYAMEDEDYRLIADWINLQRQHLGDFADAIVANGLTVEITGRLEMWAKSLGVIGGMGYMRSNQDKLGIWKLGRTKESCATCLSLEGRVERLGWFLDKSYLPGQPGSATLACGGWKCGCGIFDYATGRRLLPLVRMWY